MHRRAAIRQAVLALLAAIPGVTVTAGRVNPDTIPALPGLNVVTGPEAYNEEESIFGTLVSGPWLQVRNLNITVECRAAVLEGGALDDALDALALSVEQALNADLTLGGEVDKIEYQGADASELTGDLEQPAGVLALEYVAIYRVDIRDPQALEA